MWVFSDYGYSIQHANKVHTHWDTRTIARRPPPTTRRQPPAHRRHMIQASSGHVFFGCRVGIAHFTLVPIASDGSHPPSYLPKELAQATRAPSAEAQLAAVA